MWLFSIGLYWGNGCRDMLLNQWPYGVRLLIANMVANGGGGWCSNHSREPYGVSLWNHIRRGWTWFSQYIGFKVGDGSRIKFWSGSWSRDQLLWDRFSTLFRLARNQEALVVDYLHFHGTLPMRPGRTDSILWNLSRHASFEVSSFYSALSHQLLLSFHGG